MGDDLRMGAKNSSSIIMQTVAPLYLKSAISQTMKSQRNISNELQYNAEQALIFISKKISMLFL